MMYFLILFVFFLSYSNTIAQTSNNCESKETCEECIHEIECAWCIDPLVMELGEKPKHCYLKNDTRKWCTDGMEVSPSVSKHIVYNYDFSNDINNPIQIKPQMIKLSLRKGEKYHLKFQYKSTENYPIDLYYIMDLSASMKNYKKKLGQLGIELAETMKKITTNFRLGFGSFIDKTDLPFVNTNKSRLVPPCQNCVTPYSFKNHLSLTSDFKDFVDQVTSANDSGNLDSPEGGLDALMQAIVCKDKIKWREKARHLIVFSTDAEYHVAGDGKLAGVVEPNNGKCHLKDEYYLIYDYPSISQLNYVAKENNINIIFAIVTKGKHDIKSSYSELSKNIENSNFGELNDRDDNNVINLVVENYKKIVQTVKFTSNATDRVDVKFSSTCQSSIPDRCNNVHVGEILEFTATIQPRECNPNGQKTEFISLKPEALNEGLIVALDTICDCPCSEKTDKTYVPNSDKCSNQGDLRCGVCYCPEGRFGRQCECDGSVSVSENISNCIMEGSNEVCSGFGKCKCGKCECSLSPNGEIYGQFCQCNNYSCRKEGGLLCSGKGKCKCKSCECQAGYSGEACECEESTDKCIMKGSDQICSNNGQCDCGRCKCADGYSGTYCDECLTCSGQSHRCEEYRHCVECKAYGTGFYSKSTCEEKCKVFVTQIVDKLEDNKNKSNICTVSDNKRCMMTFRYFYENGTIMIQVLRHCNEPPKAFVWISGVVLSIIIAGIVMLLVWKIFISLHDRREYAKFEKERQALKWHRTDNPLYKEATTTFANPAYNRTSSFSPK